MVRADNGPSARSPDGRNDLRVQSAATSPTLAKRRTRTSTIEPARIRAIDRAGPSTLPPTIKV